MYVRETVQGGDPVHREIILACVYVVMCVDMCPLLCRSDPPNISQRPARGNADVDPSLCLFASGCGSGALCQPYLQCGCGHDCLPELQASRPLPDH